MTMRAFTLDASSPRSGFGVALALACAGLWALGCSGNAGGGTAERPQGGLFASPEKLTFVCVTPGCDTTLGAQVKVLGDRRVAVKRIVLEGGAKEDYEFTSTQQAPFILGGGDSFGLEVRYRPTGAPANEDARLVLSYTDAAPEESEDRLPPGELVLPLVRRLVGEPVLVANPTNLSFGAVSQGERRTLPLALSNQGFGNVALDLTEVDTGHPDLSMALPESRTLTPDAGVSLEVAYAPSTEAYTRSELVVHARPEQVSPAVVLVEGTSLPNARAAVEPSGDIDLGQVARKKKRTRTVTLMNQGGKPLTVSALTLTDASGNISAKLGGDAQLPLVLEPLQRVPVELSLDAQKAGPLDATLTLRSDDPLRSVLNVKVVGTVTEPRLTVTPATLDFGIVPVGWVVTKQLELKNTGTGELELRNLAMVSGSSGLFTLRQIPGLPLSLQKNQRITIELEFRAEASATFAGFFSIESDDPQTSFIEVPLKAVGGTCAASCPIANGTASCASNVCAVGACNAGYFDTDKDASNGCECRETGTEPGAFCSSAENKGTLKDNDRVRTQHTGVLPTADDVDVIRFYAEDAFAVFNENYNVQIRLESNDPGIRLCVYRYDTKSHVDECYFQNESCPDNRSFQATGGAGEDGADYIVKVFRDSRAPTCSPYTVYISNGIE